MKSIRYMVLLLLASTAPVWAVTYSGNLSVAGGGLTGTGDWDDGPTSIAWTVNDTASGSWHYAYVLSVPNEAGCAIDHLNLEVSPGMPQSDMFNASPGIADFGLIPDDSANNMPVAMYAAVFEEDGGSNKKLTITFDSLRAPIWGDVFAKGSRTNKIWNTGFTSSDSDPSLPISASVTDHLLRPDPVCNDNGNGNNHGVVPEPATLLLVGMGLTWLGRTLRKRIA